MNSSVLNDKYLQQIEAMYKQIFLPKMREVGEVLEIDWTEVADKMDMEMVCYRQIQYVKQHTGLHKLLYKHTMLERLQLLLLVVTCTRCSLQTYT